MKNPYLAPSRLPNLIAAITALGSYRRYNQDAAGWSDRICGDENRAAEWRQLFKEHPEFFRFSKGEKSIALVWRRQLPKRFDIVNQVEVDLLDDQKYHAGDGFSRKPLEPNELTALISVAVEMHARAIDHQNASKWWVPLAAGSLAFVGGLVGTWMSSALG